MDMLFASALLILTVLFCLIFSNHRSIIKRFQTRSRMIFYHAISGAWGIATNKKTVCGYPQTWLATFESAKTVSLFTNLTIAPCIKE